VQELLADPEIRIVANLTLPQAHFEVAMMTVEAGKSVWNEKPLTLSREEGRKLLSRAKEKKVLVGCAPDTFLGAGHQTCRKLVDDGWIGEPVAATAFMTCHGHESWHPDPGFYYKKGGGPLFDMGPYYITDLVQLLGPVARVVGSARVTFPERTITSQPKRGARVSVEVPTHVAANLEFSSGAIASLIMSFDVWAAHLSRIEIHGSRGSLEVPDPNGPGGVVRVFRGGTETWAEVPHTHGYADISRSIGVADMAYALRSGRPHRASGELAYHVLDVMHAIHDSAQGGHRVDLQSSCERPAPLPVGLRDGELDA
jgi:predicted dehydrogenase